MDNRRRHTRYKVEVAAEITLDHDTLTGETRDISAGGVSATVAQLVPEDSTVALSLILTQDGIEDPNEEPFETQASVTWAAPTEDGRAMLGLRFTQVAAEQRKRLERFLAALAEN